MKKLIAVAVAGVIGLASFAAAAADTVPVSVAATTEAAAPAKAAVKKVTHKKAIAVHKTVAKKKAHKVVAKKKVTKPAEVSPATPAQ